jgi:multiple sugar transport system ATP-binding protein
MGRAIVRDPAVFLMDEPLSNLDAKLRVQMRTEIARLQRDLATTTIYVTHDQVEAMTMGDRVAVLRDGELQQVAQPEVLYDEPDNTFVAAFTGSPSMNLVEGSLQRSSADGGGLLVRIGSHELELPAELLASRPALHDHVGRDVVVGIRAESMEDEAVARADDGPLGFLPAVVERREALGAELLVHVVIDARPVLTDDVIEVAAAADDAVVDDLERQAAAGEARLVGRFDPRSKVRAGDRVSVAIETAKLHVFEADSGVAIRHRS